MRKWFLGALLLVLSAPYQGWGATLWVDGTNGSNSNGCTDSSSPLSTGAKQTIAAGMTCLAAAGPGSTLYIRAGTYSQRITTRTSDGIPLTGGTSYSNGYTIEGYSGDGNRQVIIDGDSSGGQIAQLGGAGDTQSPYITLKNLVIKGDSAQRDLNTGSATENISVGSDNIRLDNVEIRNSPPATGNGTADAMGWIGLSVESTADGLEFINGEIHGINGSLDNVGDLRGAYGTYWRGTNGLIENSDIHDNESYGVHMFDSLSTSVSGNAIKNSRIWDNQTEAGQHQIIICCGTGNKVHNTIIRDPKGLGDQVGGIDIGARCVSCLIYNNTFYGHDHDGIGISQSDAVGTQVKNNIVVQSSGTPITDLGTATAFATNQCSSAGTGCSQTESAATTFVNPGTDFHLKSGSAAIDAGTDLGAPYNSDVFSVARPQGSGWDIGAAEFQSAQPEPQPPTLVLAMGFNELSGSAPQDSSGNSNHGTFSSTGIGDDFARTDSADLGANWDGGYNTLNNCQIVSNALRPTNAAVNCLETWNANSFSGSQFGEILIKTTAGSAAQASVILKSAAPPTFTFYRCVTRRGDGSAKTRIQRWDAGVLTESTLENASGDWASGDRLRCTAEGGTVKAYKNGSLILTYTDSSATALSGARIGASCLADDAVADCEIESFSGGDLNTGGVVYTTSGKYGRGLTFDGTGSVTVADSSSLDFTTAFTLMAWVYPTVAQTDFRAVLVKNYVYYLYATVEGFCGNGSTLGGAELNSGQATACDATTLPVDTWTHVAVSYDGNAVRLYKGGSLVASQVVTGSASGTTGTLQIGASEFGENFVGRIDEVRLYNFARTALEITTDMNTPIGVVPPAAPTGFKLQ